MGTLEANRYLYLTTPLGEDKLLLSRFAGQEGLNKLFQFELELLADNTTTVDFDKLIGQKVSFGVQGADAGQVARDLNGIVIEFSQGKRDFNLTEFKMTIVPEVWKLTRKFRSRIFQHISVPDLLKKLFEGFDVAFEMVDNYKPREYITQYQETDFAFASRLMEEEGIFYLFKFTRGAHKLVLADTPQSHPDIPGDSELIFEEIEGGERDEERISQWRKAQKWDSGKYTLWDHKFELPHKHLQATEIVKEKVQVGEVPHTLKLAGNDELEVLEHPGRYALRYDGISRSGAEQPEELENIFWENEASAERRMELGETGMIRIEGASNCRQFTAGHKFSLKRHFNGDGQYVITEVSHEAAEGSFRSESGRKGQNHYGNTFFAQPFELPYCPARATPRPVIAGTTTAVAVGPVDEEIHTDKYGRVKVKFMWDPAEDSTDNSCWTRVATSWAGGMWGSIQIPRIGQEVVVAFENGDPDAPMIVGSVYNAEQMPPYILPYYKTVSTIKSHSSKGGSRFDSYNELRFEDRKDREQVFLRAERDKDERVKAESREFVGGNRHLIVNASQLESVGGNKNSTVHGDYRLYTSGERHEFVVKEAVEYYMDNVSQDIAGTHTLRVSKDQNKLVFGDVKEEITRGDYDLTVQEGDTNLLNTLGNWNLKCPEGQIAINSVGVNICGVAVLSLSSGASSIVITPSSISINSPMVLINSGGFPPLQENKLDISWPDKPKMPKEPALPDTADEGFSFDKADLSDKM